MDQTLGEFVREKRKAKKLGVRQAAKLADVGHSHWSQVENGEEIPSSKWLAKIAIVIGVTKNELQEKAGYSDRNVVTIIREPTTVYETKAVIDGQLMTKHEIEVIRALRMAEEREAKKNGD